MKNITEIPADELKTLHAIVESITDNEAHVFNEFLRKEMIRRGLIIGVSMDDDSMPSEGSQDERRHASDIAHHGDHHGRHRTLQREEGM